MDKIWHYVNGTVRVKITGSMPERFINLCLVNKISLSGIARTGDRTLVADLNARDIKKLRPILKKSACKMRIIEKSGLPFLKNKAYRRKGFVLGGLLFCFMLYIMSNFIWSIEVSAPKPLKYISQQQMLSKANAYGLKRGTPKLLINSTDLREKLLKDFPDATWVGVEIEGTKAKITIYERAKVTDIESKAPADLVADKDAVIDDIFVISGTAVVSKGTTVREGDVLISAKVYPTAIEGQEPFSGEPTLTRAKGIVRARTWYETKASVLLKEEDYTKTGRNSYGIELTIPDGSKKNFRLTDFSAYQEKNLKSWRNKSFAIELKFKKYNELKKRKIIRTVAQAKQDAVKIAEQKLAKQLPPTAKLVNKNFIWYNIKNGLNVRAIWEVRENIGINR